MTPPPKVCDDCGVNAANHTCPNCEFDVCNDCWGTAGECADCEQAETEHGWEGSNDSAREDDFDRPDFLYSSEDEED